MNNVINIDDYLYYNKLALLLDNYKNKEVVFFCVGNYKIWYDCFASEFVDMIKKLKLNCYVYGGKKFPIVSENLCEYIEFVKQKHANACIVVVDNLLTFQPQKCGEVIISNRPPHLACFTKNMAFGDISVLLQTYPYYDSYKFLQMQSQVIDNLSKSVNKIKNIIKIV